jgi:hypothetical protein
MARASLGHATERIVAGSISVVPAEKKSHCEIRTSTRRESPWRRRAYYAFSEFHDVLPHLQRKMRNLWPFVESSMFAINFICSPHFEQAGVGRSRDEVESSMPQNRASASGHQVNFRLF